MDCATNQNVVADVTISDVVVIGGGLAGLSSSIHLAKAGLRVICFEPVSNFDRIVGESLDWSAPELFRFFTTHAMLPFRKHLLNVHRLSSRILSSFGSIQDISFR